MAEHAARGATLSAGRPGTMVAAAARRPSNDRHLRTLVWTRLRRDPVALIAAILLLALAVVVISAPLTAPRDPIRQESSVRLSPP